MSAAPITSLPAATTLTGTELIEVSQLSTTVRKSAATLSAAAADNSYNDSGSGFVAAGFAVADRVNVSGFTGNAANNILVGVITALTAGKMTIGGTDGDVIVDDAAGETVVISKWTSRRVLMSGAGAKATTTEQLTGTATDKESTPDSVAALWEQGADVASAATVSLAEGGYFKITGTTTITDIDFATDRAGRGAWLRFSGILTLTHSSTLILPTAADIATAAGDMGYFVSEGSDIIRCLAFSRADGTPLAGGGGGGSYTDEMARDALGTALVAGVGITLTVDDAGDTITVSKKVVSKFGFVATPTATELLAIDVLNEAATFPINFAGSVAFCGTNPTASFVLTIKKSSGGTVTTIGTLTISTGGAATFATTGGTTQALAAGDTLLVYGPGTADSTAANIGATLLAA